MPTISTIHAREILDSKSDPTLEVRVTLSDGTVASDSVPSGASTGDAEALEIRDGDMARYRGKGELRAVENINALIAPLLIGKDPLAQREIDQEMITADGTANKSSLGGNAIVGVSLAVCRAAAAVQKKPLYRYIADLFGNQSLAVPTPMVLLMEGGKHGNWSTDIQEYMIIPNERAFENFSEILRATSEIFHTLGTILEEKKFATGVGFEGAYCPQELTSNEDAFSLMMSAVEKAGYGGKFSLALDVASSEFFQDGMYVLKSEGDKKMSPLEWRERVISWTKNFPIVSIEDPHAQESWEDWAQITKVIGTHTRIVGDDLITTNVVRMQKAAELQSINAALIKVNQIGTVSETLDAIKFAKDHKWTTIVSHRSGETNDDFIADLAVGTNAEQVKFGGPDRGERLAKYNRLLAVEEELTVSGMGFDPMTATL